MPLTEIRWDWRSWLARQVVALKAVGSNPISHPKKPNAIALGFFQQISPAASEIRYFQ